LRPSAPVYFATPSPGSNQKEKIAFAIFFKSFTSANRRIYPHDGAFIP
jgi:hypothetical protein